ncbi:2OG-Fe(II) oxygenase superfamily protein [Oceanospirillum multiglobuliferum]|uniref:Fe2OG dioxygenase domain-containing protein n=1 Tax=Oceanospirillum multiglobuliferum TaxID=64969 RepID=A0A1T4LV40_9GAMM|nr:alpha-ketoglutarate-dependent dioxygenase AlkB [Oceanospirillum multiglobuliferum]OPX56352.1 hypothetical protein BTE48_05130 [Oceanospirillum multiglobuliferum]SJZ58517.1 2OG-Fe(II) oxygenase superfamily protein [Oceanospirillum multiglobuliferum]
MDCYTDFNLSYIENFLSAEEANALFDCIYEQWDWKKDEVIKMEDGSYSYPCLRKLMFVHPNLVNNDLFHQSHGNRMEWSELLLDLKYKVEQEAGVEFSVCVCIFYENGTQSMGYHYDPPAFGPTDIIASVSLGATRNFVLRLKSNHDKVYQIAMKSGSMLIMGKGCQDQYEHAVPEMPDQKEPRFNLTFRQFKWPDGRVG